MAHRGGVEGIAEGAYYYDPYEHALRALEDASPIDRSVHFYYNRPVFDHAHFALYLIGNRKGIEPLYREDSERFLLLEAGYMGQLLMMGQAACELGLCPIGTLAFERVRPGLHLSEEACFLHAFLGGAATYPQKAISTGERPFYAEPQPSESADENVTVIGLNGRHASDLRAITPPGPHEPRLVPKAHADIAIIGIAGRYPGAPDLTAFWQNLAQGRDSITDVPAQRVRDGWPTHLMRGGYIDNVDCFDPLFFHISPRDAERMDPQERLFLEVTWEAMEDAGYTRARLQAHDNGNVGVYVGVMHNEYPYFGVELSLSGTPTDAGTGPASIANRVSYFLGLHGPSLAVDSMCSSSHTSIHLAVQSLRQGECAMAIAGGVNLSLHPNKFLQQQRLHMSSSDGRCRSFGAGGDGFAPGEGIGAILLKPLAQAIADGDVVHAVIKGTAVNHGGKTNGYTVPSPISQGSVVRQALRDAGIAPQSISYVEAHGTGTALGDPIEIEGLLSAFPIEHAAARCAIGSVKSSIGHLEGAAGIAGLTKVVLQMEHEQLAPSLHAEALNPHIDWASSRFVVQRTLSAWPAAPGEPRRAGISAFGAGGANGHIILEAYEKPPQAPRQAFGPQLIVLSARDEERLTASAARLAGFLRSHLSEARRARIDSDLLLAQLRRLAKGELPEPLARATGSPSAQDLGAYLLDLCADPLDAVPGAGEALYLPDVAYTLQVGREAMRERAALVTTSLEELCGQLDALSRGEVDGILRGQAAGPDMPALAATEDHGLLRAASHWVAGGAVDWTQLHAGHTVRRIHLPSYPFARMRCWLQAPPTEPQSPAAFRIPIFEKGWREKGWGAAHIKNSVSPAIGPILCLYRGSTEPVARALALLAGPGQIDLISEERFAKEGALQWMPERRAGDATVRGCIDLCDLDDCGPEQAQWGARVMMLQALLNQRSGGLRLLLVTQGLQNLPGVAPSLAGARMASLLRSLGGEEPAVACTLLDTDAAMRQPDLAARQILAEWAAAGNDSEVCYRAGQRYQACLNPVSLANAAPFTPDASRVYVITGGTRGLGALVAKFLVDRGARKLALLGLQPLPPRSQWDVMARSKTLPESIARIRELEETGAQIMLFTGELTNRHRLGDFFNRVRASLGDLDGVIHCAGVRSPRSSRFCQKDAQTIAAVFAPKVEGLETLAELCAADKLSFFLMFSSVSALLPKLGVGIVDYAAANGFMDFFAGVQTRLGKNWFRSIQWPVWSESGSGATAAAVCEQAGVGTLNNEEGLAVLERALTARSHASLFPCPPAEKSFDLELSLQAKRASTMQRETTQSPAEAGSAASWLVDLFADTLHIPRQELDPRATFGELGVESVILGELLQKIEAHVGRPLPPASLLDNPTLQLLTQYLAQLPHAPTSHATIPVPTTPLTVREAAPKKAQDNRIAVIGIACNFPGADNAEAFWQNLRAGRCSVTEVPAWRWDSTSLYRREYQPGKSVSKWGGFVNNMDSFDPEYFGISPDEALCLDPATRQLLESSVACFHDAGYTPKEFWGHNVGIFVGARMSNYRLRCGIRAGSSGLGMGQNFLAARLAHQFNFHGPNLVVDSACSSALVSLQLACRSLLAGESEVALAGGVEVLLDEQPYLEFSAAKALSPSGRCSVFDEAADGFVPGEGAGLLLLKPLDRALAEGDPIHAVIHAVAVNNDGHTMGLTTPSHTAQAGVIRQCLRDSGFTAQQVAMVEAHGTGTMIGDPIELSALTEVFRESSRTDGFCAIGSVKSNLGHLLSAGGIAGLLKAILAVRHGEIPPTLFCSKPNPRFAFAGSPFFPNTGLRPWPAEQALRVAGVSAFGLGGTNAHVIVSECASALRNSAPRKRWPLPPPRFQRRRFWLEREPAHAVHSALPVAVAAPPTTWVSSLLEINFEPAHNGLSNGMAANGIRRKDA